jgi:hypothetical protein
MPAWVGAAGLGGGENQLTSGGASGYGRGVTHPLLDRSVVRAVEPAASEHLGQGWTWTGFTDLNHRRAFLPRLAAAVRQYA